MSSTLTREPILKVLNANKTYGGVYAIKDINFDLYEGEVHAIAGENGAGKSTLAKAISGAIKLTGGELIFKNAKRDFEKPMDALKAGIAMVYQETSLVPTMTVGQNINLGREKVLTRLKDLYIEGQQILQSMNFDVDPTILVERLGAAKKQMVEIARAVAWNSQVMIFDEPTATLTPEEKLHFFDLVQFLKRKGKGIIYISHALEESLTYADRITVLRDGKHIITAEAKSMTRESLVRHMVGRELSHTHYVQKQQRETSSEKKKRLVLRVENVVMGDVVKNMSFSVYSGEITGIAGLVGSGRTEIAKVIFGALKRRFIHGGMIYFEGKPIRFRVPKQAVDRGIIYLSEDRKVYGLFETMGIKDNIYVGWLATVLGRTFLLSEKTKEKISKVWIDRINIQALNPNSKIPELSGGNQQKVLVAKGIVQKPKLVIFDEPTRGVDVASIEEIHNFIRSLASEDIAIVVISSYIPEILSLADRILVARQGRIAEEFSSEEATEEKIMFAAVH